jgi:uncharacterized protein
MLQQPVGASRTITHDYGRLVLEDDLGLSFLKGHSKITRTPQGLLVDTLLQTTITAECGRCLTEFPYDLQSEFTELFVFSRVDRSEDDLVLPEDGYIDLGPIAREQLLLEIPINLVCKPDCKGLCSICGVNKNEEDCGHVVDTIDPRLSGLKSLLNDS